MERTLTKQIYQKAGCKVRLLGWVHVIRKQGKISFLLLRDISGIVQTVTSKENIEVFSVIQKLSEESVIEIIGSVKEEKQAPGGYEVQIDEIKIISEAPGVFPIPIIEKGEETEQQKRLDFRWLDLRKPEKRLIFQVWTTMEKTFRDFCIQEDFIEIHSPKLTVTSTESGSELFPVKYFDRTAYLVQSPQLYKQMAMAAGFEKVFEIGPVFRANPSFTSRHDTEFTMYDVEISFIESHHDLLALEEQLIQVMVQEIKEKYGSEIQKFYKRELIIPEIPFPRFSFREVKNILLTKGVVGEKVDDLCPEEERAICEYVQKEKGHEFVFIYDYPASGRAFYSMRHETDPALSKTFDLLWNGLEITSGAQREHRYEKLLEQIKEKGLKTEPFESYLNFFKYGCPPHGGFAPGPTRMLMKIFDINSVREVTYLYRGVNRLTP